MITQEHRFSDESRQSLSCKYGKYQVCTNNGITVTWGKKHRDQTMRSCGAWPNSVTQIFQHFEPSLACTSLGLQWLPSNHFMRLTSINYIIHYLQGEIPIEYQPICSSIIPNSYAKNFTMKGEKKNTTNLSMQRGVSTPELPITTSLMVCISEGKPNWQQAVPHIESVYIITLCIPIE